MIAQKFGDFLVVVVAIYYFIASMCVLSSYGEEKESEESTVNISMKCNNKGVNCTCPMDPITANYPDPADPTCTWYYMCHMGYPFRKKCDPRFAFHPYKHVCLPRHQVLSNVCKPAVDCMKDGYLPDPFDCTKYYLCFYRQSYHYGCTYDHYYNTTKGQCILDKARADTCPPMYNAPEDMKNNTI